MLLPALRGCTGRSREQRHVTRRHGVSQYPDQVKEHACFYFRQDNNRISMYTTRLTHGDI